MDPKKMLGVHKAAEKFWLGIAVMAVLASAYFIWKGGIAEKKYLILPGIAVVWYLFRRMFRKRLEKQISQHNQEEQ
ncbi:MAG: hypothetical protein ACPGED_09255 [Flavobacteriales bacterium]